VRSWRSAPRFFSMDLVLSFFLNLSSLDRYNYPTFLNLYATMFYIPISFAYILPMAKFGSSIPSSHFHMSKRPFFVMGALDSIGSCLQVLSSIYLPGKLLVLLPQAAIPLSIVLSRWLLRERFTRFQYLGAGVVFLGILVVLFPIWTSQQAPDYSCQVLDGEFWDEHDFCNVCQMETNQEDCLSHRHIDVEDSIKRTRITTISDQWGFDLEKESIFPTTSPLSLSYCQWISKDESLRDDDVLILIWSLVMIASCVPMTFSSIYKQIALSAHANLDPLFVNGWVAVFQFLCSVPLAIPAGFASSPSVTPWNLPQNWHDAWQCLFASHNSLQGGCHPDQCHQAALWVHLGLVSSTSYMVLIIFMLKYGSSALLYMALTVMVPLGHLIFALHDPSSIQSSDVLGLLVLLTGLILYRFGHDDEEEQQPQHNSGTPRRNVGSFRRWWLRSTSTTSPVEGDEEPEDGMYFRFFREPFLLSGDV
jgi:drug/metabolite transporter (DMT)-like permease